MRTAVAFVLLGMSMTAGNAFDGPDRFTISVRKPTDAVAARGDSDETVFVVKSPSGIGQAIIERTTDAWPKRVVVRFELKGLESFRAANGTTTLNAAVSIQDARQWLDAKEDAPLNKNSPHWMAIRIVGGDGKAAPSLPLKDGGFFELALPPAFFEKNPKSLTLHWIDFYRN